MVPRLAGTLAPPGSCAAVPGLQSSAAERAATTQPRTVPGHQDPGHEHQTPSQPGGRRRGPRLAWSTRPALPQQGGALQQGGTLQQGGAAPRGGGAPQGGAAPRGGGGGGRGWGGGGGLWGGGGGGGGLAEARVVSRARRGGQRGDGGGMRGAAEARRGGHKDHARHDRHEPRRLERQHARGYPDDV